MGPYTRRAFCKQIITLAGTVLVVRNHAVANAGIENMLSSNVAASAMQWMHTPGTAQARVDGYPKVTGEKIFARDFRARDISAWPDDERRATIIGATRCDKVFCGIDLSAIPAEISPIQVITEQGLRRDSITAPAFFGPRLFTPVDRPASYLGEPVAMLIFKDTPSYLAAMPFLANADKILCYGKSHPLKPITESYFDARLLYFDGGEDDAQGFSSVKDQGLVPYDLSSWRKLRGGNREERAAFFADVIARQFEQEAAARVFSFQGSTQTVDPAFMEPEGGLAYYQTQRKKLSLVLSTQSPFDDGQGVEAMAVDPDCAFPLKHLEINSCYPGGGFGGRDRSILPIYLSLAGFYSRDTPVRLILSRYQQMKMVLKRHAAKVNTALLIDEDGVFQALKAEVVLDGGGRKNYSPYVALGAAQNLACAYYVPRADIAIKAERSIGVPAGSMRGFGTVQAIFATESLIDMAAYKLRIDPIELRLNNALRENMPILRGAVPNSTIRITEILNAAKGNRLWQQRDQIRAAKSDKGKRYGVGFALAMKNFGTNDDAYYARVELDQQGRVSVATGYIDMGNGAATVLATTPGEYLGQNASHISMGRVEDVAALQLYENRPLDQQDLEAKAQDQYWTAKLLSSAAASNSVFQQREVLRQACKILFQQSIWPCALTLWGIREANPDSASWQGSYLTLPGYKPLPARKLAAHAFRQQQVSGVMTHAYYKGMWATASFPMLSAARLPVDAVAIKSAGQPWQRVARSAVLYPPLSNSFKGVDLYSSCAVIIGVCIDEASGKVCVDQVESFIECGKVLQRQIVESQALGGITMGIGQALSEMLPTHAGGAGEGTWNFDRYHLPRGQDFAETKIGIHLLEPKNETEPPKGVGEVVMVPIIPAIANAVFHATGERIETLPVTLKPHHT